MKDNNLAYKYSQGSRRKRNHFTIVRHLEILYNNLHSVEKSKSDKN